MSQLEEETNELLQLQNNFENLKSSTSFSSTDRPKENQLTSQKEQFSKEFQFEEEEKDQEGKQDQGQQNQKQEPEDFTTHLKKITNNNYAQEFHKYCFHTLLKRKNKKFRNIFTHNFPTPQKTQQSTLSNETQVDIQQILSSMKLFDYQDIEQIIEQSKSDNIPIISSKGWAISDSKKGEVLYGKEIQFQREIASLTKIMTAYTTVRILHELNIQNPQNLYLRVNQKAAQMIGTSANLRQDQRINIYDCLHALLLPSGNDAAIVLAMALGKWLYFTNTTGRKGSQMQKQKPAKQDQKHINNFDYGHEEYIKAFVNEMNRQAKKLKLLKVNFSNPHGLSEKANHASPQDICKIGAYALKYDLIREIVQKKRYQCQVVTKWGDLVKYEWFNSNKLLSNYFQGIKTGITPTAGPCLCSLFQHQDFSTIAVIMDAKNVDVRWKEIAILILWAFDKYLKKQQQINQQVNIPFSNQRQIAKRYLQHE